MILQTGYSISHTDNAFKLKYSEVLVIWDKIWAEAAELRSDSSTHTLSSIGRSTLVPSPVALTLSKVPVMFSDHAFGNPLSHTLPTICTQSSLKNYSHESVNFVLISHPNALVYAESLIFPSRIFAVASDESLSQVCPHPTLSLHCGSDVSLTMAILHPRFPGAVQYF